MTVFYICTEHPISVKIYTKKCQIVVIVSETLVNDTSFPIILFKRVLAMNA